MYDLIVFKGEDYNLIEVPCGRTPAGRKRNANLEEALAFADGYVETLAEERCWKVRLLHGPEVLLERKSSDVK